MRWPASLHPVLAAIHLAGGLACALALVSVPAAVAQDDPFGDDEDFVFDDDDTPRTPPPEPDAEAPPAEPAPPTDDEDVFTFEDEVAEDPAAAPPEEDLFGDERTTADAIREPGQDTTDIYRAALRDVRGMPPDEEVMAWEDYLETYPNALSRARIEARIQELVDKQFDAAARGGSIDGEAVEGTVDLSQRELLMVSPLRLPALNPRSRVLAGFVFGYPIHIEAWADFEYAILRKLSVHAGVWGRYQGWGLEFGVKGSPVKSGRDRVVFTPALDLRLNFGPLLFAVRPQLGVGAIVSERVQILANFGSEIQANAQSSVAVFGGLHLSFRLAPPVALFVESDVYARRLTRPDGAFVFANTAVGLRFFPRLKNRTNDPLEVIAAGMVRSASRYTEYYQGAVAVQAAYYLDNL